MVENRKKLQANVDLARKKMDYWKDANIYPTILSVNKNSRQKIDEFTKLRDTWENACRALQKYDYEMSNCKSVN